MTTERLCPKCNAPALENMRFDGDDEVPAYQVYECKRMVFETGLTNDTVECLRNQLAAALARADEAEAKVKMVDEMPEERCIFAVSKGRFLCGKFNIFSGRIESVEEAATPWQALRQAHEGSE
jgi:hypothetical protein